MQKFFQVLSNVKHNADDLVKGSVFAGDLEEFGHLVDLGALKIVDGVETLEEAQEKVAQPAAPVAAEAAPVKQNTWGPKKPETTASEPVKEQAADVKTDGNQSGEPVKPEGGEAAPELKPGAVGTGDVAPSGDNL